MSARSLPARSPHYERHSFTSHSLDNLVLKRIQATAIDRWTDPKRRLSLDNERVDHNPLIEDPKRGHRNNGPLQRTSNSRALVDSDLEASSRRRNEKPGKLQKDKQKKRDASTRRLPFFLPSLNFSPPRFASQKVDGCVVVKTAGLKPFLSSSAISPRRRYNGVSSTAHAA